MTKQKFSLLSELDEKQRTVEMHSTYNDMLDVAKEAPLFEARPNGAPSCGILTYIVRKGTYLASH
ncbi:hypothetical protein KIN20_026734 [Parelaphostrongylus tenuis]|uniref:Uncharacterized protein n=1 Tax=Parelaphostrongylus tenuis TaxID=148309 RepID=A0AAD5QYD8_PARTN|nr:hypothetical protein KIN20_026734 [Parelaphostrongylus tenuis]